METIAAMSGRVSSNSYDKTKVISENEIKNLIAIASEAPSSLNLQPWRCVAITSTSAKEKLGRVVFDQNKQKVNDASMTIIILGDLYPEKDQPRILEQTIAAGIFTLEKAKAVAETTVKWYGDKPIFKREEAIRGASLFAMSLMLAAQAKGYISGPMIGFDSERVQTEFKISDRFFPVMMLTIGFAIETVAKRKPRFSPDEIISFNEAKF